LFDNSLQGIARTDRVAFSFQGHPEASPGPHHMGGLFQQFVRAMENRLESQGRLRQVVAN
jgi:carbamoyl-phosphate synthase small subunit